jgi:hypothetical protein
MELAQSLFRLPWTASLAIAEEFARAVMPISSGPAARVLLPPIAQLLSGLPAGPESDLEYQEFRNKWQIINLVENATGDQEPLTTMVRSAYGLDPFFTLWAIEGIGQQYAAAATAQGGQVRGLFVGSTLNGIPGSAFPMLHAGMGLSFASAALDSLPGKPTDSEVWNTLEQFVALCQANSRRGYLGAALESLGLVARLSYEGLVPVLDARLRAMDRRIAGYFWHGVGRAIYFLPVNSLPSCGIGQREFQMARFEAPHELGYLNCIAGLTWAVVLVNMRQPPILEAAFGGAQELFPAAGAFANGIFSAASLRQDTTPGDPDLTALCVYRPKSGGSRFLALWDENVKRPCRLALRSPISCYEDLFQYQPAA